MDFPPHVYSTLEIKSLDADQRVLEGYASTPTLDGVGHMMDPKGAAFTLPHSLLWQHRQDKPIGHVVSAQVTPKGIYIKAQLAPKGLLQWIDDAWTLIASKMVRGLSIGWRPIDMEPVAIKGGGVGLNVKKWAWLETSCVTIPANVETTILAVKHADAASLAALREPRISSAPPGVSGLSRTTMTYSEQIQSTQQDLLQKTSRIEELMQKEEVEGLPDLETKELGAASDAVKALTKKIDLLRTMENAQMLQATAVTVPAPRDHKVTHLKAASRLERPELEKGTVFIRYAMAVAASGGSVSDAIAYAKRFEAETPEVVQYIKAVAGTTTGGSPAWGAELVGDPVSREFVDMYLPKTIIGRLNIPRSPFNTRITIQTGGATIGWVGELGVKPVGEQNYTDVTLPWHKAAGIVVLSKELVRFSRPSAEAQVRRDMEKQVVAFLDQQFIDPSVAAGATNPASITNDVTPVPASGTDADALITDFTAALDPFDETDMGSNGLTVVMRPGQARHIGMMRDSLGNVIYMGLGPDGGTLFGYPVITSTGVPSGYIVIIKNSEILLALDDSVQLDSSDQATLDMAGGSSPNYNLWQRNAVGIRAEQYATWKARQDGAVAVISGAAYTPAVGS